MSVEISKWDEVVSLGIRSERIVRDWPEWKAFAKRAGLDGRYVKLVLELHEPAKAAIATVTHLDIVEVADANGS